MRGFVLSLTVVGTSSRSTIWAWLPELDQVADERACTPGAGTLGTPRIDEIDVEGEGGMRTAKHSAESGLPSAQDQGTPVPSARG